MKLLSFTCCKEIKLPDDKCGSFLNSVPQAANPEFGNTSCDSGKTLLKGLPPRPAVDAWQSGRQLVLGFLVHISTAPRSVLQNPFGADRWNGCLSCLHRQALWPPESASFSTLEGRWGGQPLWSVLLFYSHLGYRAVRRLVSFLMRTRFQVDRAGTVSGRPDSGPSPGLIQGLRNTCGAI